MDAMILNLTMAALITSVIVNGIQWLITGRVLQDLHRSNRWAEHGPDLLQVLRSVEWAVTKYTGPCGQCPSCERIGPGSVGFAQHGGHADGCTLEAVIKAVEGRS